MSWLFWIPLLGATIAGVVTLLRRAPMRDPLYGWITAGAAGGVAAGAAFMLATVLFGECYGGGSTVGCVDIGGPPWVGWFGAAVGLATFALLFRAPRPTLGAKVGAAALGILVGCVSGWVTVIATWLILVGVGGAL